MLIVLKNNSSPISKRELAKQIGVDLNSIQKWRTIYLKEGITGIVSHGRKGFKPSLISKEEHKKIHYRPNIIK